MTMAEPHDYLRGHWCEFCQTYHSSTSCYHPGAKRLQQAEAEVERLKKLLQGKVDDWLVMAEMPSQTEYRRLQDERDRLKAEVERIGKVNTVHYLEAQVEHSLRLTAESEVGRLNAKLRSVIESCEEDKADTYAEVERLKKQLKAVTRGCAL